ncbi:MAG: hypothetical protein RSE41_08775 [Clostridia bacterium]
MRYYVYLDRDLLSYLFSSIEDNKFDLEALIYISEEGNINEKVVNLNPGIHKRNEDGHDDKRSDNGKKVEILYENKDIYNKYSKRIYINIEDVTKIKNLSFYNKLITKLEETKETKLFVGNINLCKLREYESDKNEFFYINDNYIWINNKYIETDLCCLSKLSKNIKVLGYKIDDNIYKAIAIYI